MFLRKIITPVSETDSKIKAACSRYQVARKGLVDLWGKGEWELKLQELCPEDIWGLSEKALVSEEREQRKRTQEMAGISTDGASESGADHNRLNQELPPTMFNPHLAVGEGHRTLSWIWYTTSQDEIIGKSVTTSNRIGSCKLLSILYLFKPY